MPSLDSFIEIRGDPNFIDTFSVTRNTQSINPDGRAVDTPTIISMVYGFVAPVTNSVIEKFPEGEVQHGDIVIDAAFRLTDGHGTSDFDVVTWNGKTYQVKSVSDWSRFGTGYIEAVCTLNKVSP